VELPPTRAEPKGSAKAAGGRRGLVGPLALFQRYRA
jgi:hypothetical protein